MSNQEKKGDPIDIKQVSNGFMVRPGYNPVMGHPEFIGEDKQYVFESMSGLIDHLKRHFSHRNDKVVSD